MMQKHEGGQIGSVDGNTLMKMERDRLRPAHTSTLSIAAISVTSNISPLGTIVI